MFRVLLILVLLNLLATELFAATGKILQVNFDGIDFKAKPTLCLTKLELNDKSLVILIEDIYDCHWARKAKSNQDLSLGEEFEFNEFDFEPATQENINIEHLALGNPKAQFFISIY